MSIDGPSKRERVFFDAAKTVSRLSNHKCKLGCVVVDKHRIISSGYNSKTKYHRVQAELDQKFFGLQTCLGPVHAEVSALLPLINKHVDLSGATLYIYRQNFDGDLAMARPCDRCMKLIKEQGIKRIKYTTQDGFAFERLVY